MTLSNVDADDKSCAHWRWHRLGLVFAAVAGASWLIAMPVLWINSCEKLQHIFLPALTIAGVVLFLLYWAWLIGIDRFRKMRRGLAVLATAWAAVSLPFALWFNGILIWNDIQYGRFTETITIGLPLILFLLFQGLAAAVLSVYAWKLPR